MHTHAVRPTHCLLLACRPPQLISLSHKKYDAERARVVESHRKSQSMQDVMRLVPMLARSLPARADEALEPCLYYDPADDTEQGREARCGGQGGRAGGEGVRRGPRRCAAAHSVGLSRVGQAPPRWAMLRCAALR